MTDQITWRTTDLTRWGSGLGSPLSKSQVDINFWVCLTRLIALEDHAAVAAVGISSFYINPSNAAEFFVVLTDTTILGPYALPASTWNFTNPPTGAWVPLSGYAVNDVFMVGTSLYVVLIAHTSASTFSAGATDGSGHDLYKLLITAFPPDLDVSPVTGSTYTLLSGDANKYVRFTNTSGCSVTVPPNVFALNTELELRDASTVTTGGLTMVAGAGVTFNGIFGYQGKTAAYGGIIGLKQVATNNWDMTGLLALA